MCFAPACIKVCGSEEEKREGTPHVGRVPKSRTKREGEQK